MTTAAAGTTAATPLLRAADLPTLTRYLAGTLVLDLGLPRDYARVLRAFLSHAGWHGNRVWAGVTCLARESGLSESTVKRALAEFRRALGLRIVRGAAA